MKFYSLMVVAIIGLTFVGCDQIARSKNGPVAVVDLDLIAQKLGKDKQMLQMIEQRQVNLNEQVIAAQKSLIDQLNQRKSELGELSEEESNQLAQLQKKANSILASTQTQAQTNLTSFQQDIINGFRNEVKPIAMELANKKGCRVVLSKNDSVVFAFDATVDLTNEVVARMQSKLATTSTPQSTAKGTQAVVKQAAVEQQANTRR